MQHSGNDVSRSGATASHVPDRRRAKRHPSTIFPLAIITRHFEEKQAIPSLPSSDEEDTSRRRLTNGVSKPRGGLIPRRRRFAVWDRTTPVPSLAKELAFLCIACNK